MSSRGPLPFKGSRPIGQPGSTPDPADSPCPVEAKVTVPLTSSCSPAACWIWKQAVRCCSDSFHFVIGNQTAGRQGSRSLSISPSMCLNPLPSVSSISLRFCLFINLHLFSSPPPSLSVSSGFILLFSLFLPVGNISMYHSAFLPVFWLSFPFSHLHFSYFISKSTLLS